MPYADKERQRAFNRRWINGRRQEWLSRQVCRRCRERKPDLHVLGKGGRRVSFSRRDIDSQVHTVLCTECLTKGRSEMRAGRAAEQAAAKRRARRRRAREQAHPGPVARPEGAAPSVERQGDGPGAGGAPDHHRGTEAPAPTPKRRMRRFTEVERDLMQEHQDHTAAVPCPVHKRDRVVRNQAGQLHYRCCGRSV